MLIPLLALQSSLLVHPIYLDESPPELRTARNILVLYQGEGVPEHIRRGPEEAERFAHQIAGQLQSGAPFELVAERASDDVNARDGACLGTVAPGMLTPALDAFLFSAELGDVSDPLQVGGGFQILQRVDTRVAALQILFSGDESVARCDAALAELAGGADFGAFAREHSDDPVSAARGGQLAIFERTRRDKLLKRAAFGAELGQVAGPVRTPFGLHLVKRVPLDEVDPALAENHWVRARAILIQHDLAHGADPATARAPEEAQRIAFEVHARIVAGESMAELASEFDEDAAGAARAGDLGWIHRFAPRRPVLFDSLFRADAGTLFEPTSTPAGWLILRRER